MLKFQYFINGKYVQKFGARLKKSVFQIFRLVLHQLPSDFRMAETLVFLACTTWLNKNTARKASANPLVSKFGMNIQIPHMAEGIVSHILRPIRKYP